MARRRFVAGNWKMHGSLGANAALLAGVREAAGQPGAAEVAACVPFPYLQQAQTALAGNAAALGAQNVSDRESGAFTGEVSASMLADFGCRYVIVGHSERRALFGEDDVLIGRKARAVAAKGMTPILCVGETLAERDAGRGIPVVIGQLDAALESGDPASPGGAPRGLVVAYEPVWAIGTGRTASPEQAQEVHAAIRARLAARGSDAEAIRILYGGSVKPASAPALFAMPDIDGGLIGGASLVAAEFAAICAAAATSGA